MSASQEPKVIKSLKIIAEQLEELHLDDQENWEAAQPIADLARCLFSADYVAVFNPQVNPEAALMPLAENGEVVMSKPRQLWLSKLIIRAAGSETAILALDLNNHPEQRDQFTILEDISGYAAIILRSKNTKVALAVIYLECRKKNRQCSLDEKQLLLFAEQSQILRQNAWLAHISETLSSLRDQITQSGKIIIGMLDWLREVSNADLVTVFPYFEDLKRFDDSPHLSGEKLRKNFYRPTYFRSDDMAWLAVQYGLEAFASDSGTLYQQLGGPTDSPRLGTFEEREKVLSSAMLPLTNNKELIGVLFFNFRQQQSFDEPQKTLLRALSKCAAQALKITRERGKRAERHVKELSLLKEIDEKIKGDLELEELLDEILKLAQAHITNAEDATALIYTSATKELIPKASQGPNRQLRFSKSKTSLDDDEPGIIKWACRFRTPARIPDVNNEEWGKRYKKVIESTMSELDIPLFDDEQLVGALNFESSKPDAFSADDLNFLITLSNRAVHVIKKAQAKECEKAVQNILQAGLEILSIEDSKSLLETILGQALTVTDSTQGAILLYDQRWDDLYVVAQRGVKDEVIPSAEHEIVTRYRLVEKVKGIVWSVINDKKPLIANLKDPKWEEVYLPFFKEEGGWQLTVPILKNQSEVRGLIAIERSTNKPFTKEDQELITQMAVLAENALRNSEHSEMRKRLKTLHEVDDVIIKQLDDPAEVLKEILDQALLLTQAEQGDLHIYQNGTPCITYFARKENNKSNKIVERGKLEGTQSENLSRGIVRHVAETKNAYRTGEDAQTDKYYKSGEKGNTQVHSEIAVPLLADNELLGVLNLESVDYDDLNEADVELMELLAGQAVIAYQNALRFRQAREAIDRFKILLDVGQKLSEVTSLDEKDVEKAYSIIAEPLAGFSKGGWITIRRYEEYIQELVCKWRGGHDSDGTEFPPHPIGHGVAGYVAQRWLDGDSQKTEPVVYTDVKSLSQDDAFGLDYKVARAFVAAPLFFKEQFYGVLSLSNPQADYFKGDDVKLVVGLAAQLGVTLHRLEVTRQKQEADWRDAVNKVRLKTSQEMANNAMNVAHRYVNTFRPILTQADKLRHSLEQENLLSSKLNGQLDELIRRANKGWELNKQFKDLAEGMKIGQLSDKAFSSVVLRELVEDVIADLESFDDKDENLSVDEAKKPDGKYEYVFAFDKQLAKIRVASEQIKAILEHLIGNGREAMSNGGKLIFKARNLDKHVELQITDTGPGVPYSLRDKIFEYGFSGKKSTGFGLAIARYYATNNGGDLKLAEPQPGEGATFILLLRAGLQ